MGRFSSLLLSSLAAVPLTTVTNIPNAFADVNMMEASFQTTLTDLEIGGLKISRRYNSRSNFNGAFGFGWCSIFDTKLELSTTPDGKTLTGLNECGTRMNLGAQANGIRVTPQGYTQTLKTGLTRTFSLETGEVVSLRNGIGPEVRVERIRSRLPRDAALGEGLRVRLEYDGLKENIVALGTSDGKRLEFTYSPARDLISARNAWSNTYRFNYDDLHNLIRIDYPDHTTEKMSYDADHDRLLSFEGRDGCEETYSHRFDASEKTLHQVSVSKLECAGQTKRQVEFDFTYTKRAPAAWSLTNLSVKRTPKTRGFK